jgi:hypothetical protein
VPDLIVPEVAASDSTMTTGLGTENIAEPLLDIG